MFSLEALEILPLISCRTPSFSLCLGFQHSSNPPFFIFSPFLQSSPHKMKESSPLGSRKISDKIHFQTIHSESSDTFSDQSPTMARGLLIHQSRAQTEVQFVNEEDLESLGAAAPPLPLAEELKAPASSTTQSSSKTDSPSRKKGMKPSMGLPAHSQAAHQRHSSLIQSFK